MNKENASIGKSRSRYALGDVTNRIEKDGVKSFDFNGRDAVKRVCVSPRPCSEINSLKGNAISSLSKIPNQNTDSNLYDDCGGVVHCLKGKHKAIGSSKLHSSDKGKILDFAGGNIVSQCVDELENVDIDSGDRCSQTELSKKILPSVNEVAAQSPNNLEGGNGADDYMHTQLDTIKESKISGAGEVANENKSFSLDLDTPQPVKRNSNDFLQNGQKCCVGEVIINLEGNQSDMNDHHNELDDQNAENFVLSQSGSVDCGVLPQSQESRVFGIDKSTETKDEECANMTLGTHAIKECSCSFCTKAGYIWLDLHQKDIKARLSALKKSQKDASILAERSCRMKMNETCGVETINRASKLESHLMHQWRSLFQHMSAVWETESNQLEASLSPLNDLRERCKAEMEWLNVKHSERH